jgi:hypothetical protein
MKFPQFRKYLNAQSYFKILSAEELVELKVMGTYYSEIRLKALTMPDRNFISDLLHRYHSFAVVISEDQFEA